MPASKSDSAWAIERIANNPSEFSKNWREAKGFRFHVALLEDEDGSYSVVSLNLPGICSCGESEEEALASFHEAAGAALDSYADNGMAIPWQESVLDDVPANASLKWILVNA